MAAVPNTIYPKRPFNLVTHFNVKNSQEHSGQIQEHSKVLECSRLPAPCMNPAPDKLRL